MTTASINMAWDIEEGASAPALIQSKSAQNAGTNTITVTLDAPSTTGNLLVAVIARRFFSGSNPINTPSGWTARADFTGDTNRRLMVFTKTSAGETSVTITSSQIACQAASLHEFENIDTDDPFDQVDYFDESANTVAGINVDVGPITPSISNTLMFAVAALEDDDFVDDSPEWTNSFTQIASEDVTDPASSDLTMRVAYRVVSSVAAYSTSYTPASGGNEQRWGALLSFNGTGGGNPPDPTNLDLPAAEIGATVLMHHTAWVAGDLTVTAGNLSADLTVPGDGSAGDQFASGDFRLITRLDGKFELVTDDITGLTVLEITHSAAYPVASRHSEIEPIDSGSRIFFMPGNRYVVDFYRRDLYPGPDDHWEIDWQLHGIADGTSDTATNPPIAYGPGDTESYTTSILNLKGEADLVKPAGSYDRQVLVELTELPHSGFDTDWHYWRIEFEIDYSLAGTNGYLEIIRDSTTIYSESGNQLGFNDAKGHIWQMGYYKYFTGTNDTLRVGYYGPVRVQQLA